jgi:hypothetical protein
MRQLAARGGVDYLNIADPCWFLHTARAARQALEIVQGQVPPPLHLRDLIFETEDTRAITFQAPEMIQAADILLVEASTLNSIDVEGWELNPHRVWHATRDNDPRIQGAIRRKVTAQDIAADLNAIARNAGKPVVVANHIALTGQPDLDQARASLTQALMLAAEQAPFALFDTAGILTGTPLADALKDHNHYHQDFELTVGQAMLARMHLHLAETLGARQAG